MLKRAIGYVEKDNFLGGLANYNFLDNTLQLVDDEDNLHTYDIADVELLHTAFILNGVEVFNKDVLGVITGDLLLVELQSNGLVKLHKLNEKLETMDSGEEFDTSNTATVEALGEVLTLVGNIYELEVENLVDFNVKIVKHYDGSHFTYYYACNNKSEEEVDLIKVLYMGHHLLEEEEYERETLSYEDYLSRIEDGSLVEVSPQELSNYVLGASYGNNKSAIKQNPETIATKGQVEVCCEVEDKEDAEILDGICESCNRKEDLCDCELWDV